MDAIGPAASDLAGLAVSDLAWAARGLLRVVLADIARFGHHVTGVFPRPADRTPEQFTCTTGAAARLGVGLALTTVPFTVAGSVLTAAAARLAARLRAATS
ncbi:hypothetical protein [Streptomyces sp. NPDC001380]|uniref:hypothetical protein n=1 Tax=Streptomyces sp. NPDC001380 TaxID=3364566 RepID=UPI0036CA65DC